MKIAIRHPKDFYAGLLFFAFGAVALVVARHYPMGSLLRMGAGYFPVVLGAGLALLGVSLMLRALILSGEKIVAIAAKPLLLVLGSVLAFGLVLRPLGLIAASMILVAVSSLAQERFRLKEILLLAVLLTAVSWALFVLGLGLPLPVLPG